MKLLSELRGENGHLDLATLVQRIPYAQFLGVHVEQRGNEITLVMPFKDSLIGNVMLPALHGGTIGALLEFTAVIQLLAESESTTLPKTVDFSIDYLRSGRPETTYARASIAKHGRRVANVQVEAWQSDRGKPIASGHGHFMLSP
jgi:uncharacterized protein (TIGR00369 family)